MSGARAVARAATALLAGWLLSGASGAAPAEVTAPGGAVERLALALAEEIASRTSEGPLAVHVASASPGLSRAVETLLVAELSRRGLGGMGMDVPDPAAAEARARNEGARALARVAVGLERGRLSARGELMGTWVNFWSGRTPTRPPYPAALLQAAVDADPRALALLAAPAASPQAPGNGAGAAVKAELASAVLARLPAPVAALAAGDLDRDGVDEVAAVTDDEVVLLAPDGRVLARHDLRGLRPAAAAVRDSIASATMVQGRLAYFHARRARGELLAFAGGALQVVRELEEVPLAGGTTWGKWVPGENVLDARTRNWSAPAPFHSLSVFKGTARTDAVAVLPGGAGTLMRGFPSASREDDLAEIGAATTLCDLDGDGAPELATSSPAQEPEPEELRVSPVDSPPGTPPTWRLPVARGRALAAAAARLDRGRAQQLLLGLALPDGTGEVLVYQRVAP